MKLTIKLTLLVLTLALSFGLLQMSAQQTAPAPLVRIGTSDKICQAVGDTDWETRQPTPAQTFTRARLDAADLGYPVEHAGKLFLLFGDSWPPHHPPGSPPDVPPDDSVGVTTRTVPPTPGECLGLEIHRDSSNRYTSPTIIGPVAVKQGFFNVPSGGVSVGGQLHAFFWTDHCVKPGRLDPAPDDPLSRPAATKACPETEASNSLGKGVLARSDDEGRTFSHVVSMPTGFVYATAVNLDLEPDLRPDQKLGVFIFASARYRASVPYLAYAPAGSFDDPKTWKFFTGLSANGQPNWVTHEKWERANQLGPWRPTGNAEVFTPLAPVGRCVGELSVTWNRVLDMWLMLYNCNGAILARVAHAPWGPWSNPTIILSKADAVDCCLVMASSGCDHRRNYWPNAPGIVNGGFYAPFVLNRYTEAASGGGHRATIYWVLSTWNPYTVVVMRTTLQPPPPYPDPPPHKRSP